MLVHRGGQNSTAQEMLPSLVNTEGGPLWTQRDTNINSQNTKDNSQAASGFRMPGG